MTRHWIYRRFFILSKKKEEALRECFWERLKSCVFAVMGTEANSFSLGKLGIVLQLS